MKLNKIKIEELELDELKNISGGQNVISPISTRDTLSYTNTARAMSETEVDVEYE